MSYDTSLQDEASYLIFKPFHIHFNWLNKLNEIFNNENVESEVVGGKASLKNERKASSSQCFSRRATSVLYKKNELKLFKLHNSVDSEYDYFAYESMLIDHLKASRSESDALKVLAQMWKDRILCDLIIVANGREHLAHRVALAFHSEKYK